MPNTYTWLNLFLTDVALSRRHCITLIFLRKIMFYYFTDKNSKSRLQVFYKKKCHMLKYLIQLSVLCIWFEAITEMIIKSSIFWNIMICSVLKVNWNFIFHLQGWRVKQARNKRDAFSNQISEISVDFHMTIRHYIPGDWTLHSHRCMNFKSCQDYVIQMIVLFW
jgi:hypothetical protein